MSAKFPKITEEGLADLRSRRPLARRQVSGNEQQTADPAHPVMLGDDPGVQVDRRTVHDGLALDDRAHERGHLLGLVLAVAAAAYAGIDRLLLSPFGYSTYRGS